MRADHHLDVAVVARDGCCDGAATWEARPPRVVLHGGAVDGDRVARAKIRGRRRRARRRRRRRRRDVEPQAKAVIVVDAKTQKRVEKVAAIRIERHTGDIVFQPATAPGDYHVYYLPHRAPRHSM
ncbi:MAG: DUF6067 family protein, partial [Pirellulales bacterium]|nr:DUF6067 family protein [Pirellulales bacterium]